MRVLPPLAADEHCGPGVPAAQGRLTENSALTGMGTGSIVGSQVFRRLSRTAAFVIIALVANAALPCFALGAGPEAAMACCKAKGHHGCQTGSMAEQCCRHGESGQQDRDVQPNAGVAVATAPALTAAAIGSVVMSFLNQAVPAPAVAEHPTSPPRNCPLLI